MILLADIRTGIARNRPDGILRFLASFAMGVFISMC